MARADRNLSPTEASDQLGVSVRALRLYERRGLVRPLRTSAGWRVYGPDEISKLHQVLTLKSLGLSLARIRELTLGHGVALDTVLALQEAALIQRRDDIGRALKAVKAARDRLADQHTLSLDELTALVRETRMTAPDLRVITAKTLHFGSRSSTPVIPGGLRLVLPVPAFKGGGEPLTPPKGEGLPDVFVDYHGQPITGRGLVFFNPDDRCWQAVRGDGSGVVIFNVATPREEDQRTKLERVLARALDLATDPERLSVERFKEIIAYAIDVVGVTSAYTSTRDFVAGAMSRAGADTGFEAFGVFRRNSEPARAVYVPGSGVFEGPERTAQCFDDGAVIIRQRTSVHLAQIASFEATYRRPDGSPVHATDLARQSP